MFAIQPPRSPEEEQALTQQINEYLTRPDVRAALLQFASSVLQPVQPGQTVLGKIGGAIGDAAGAAGRVTQIAEEKAQKQRAQQQTQQQLDLERKRILGGLDIQQQKVGLEKQRVGLEKQRVGLEKSQFDLQRQQLLAAAQGAQKDLAKEDRTFRTDIYKMVVQNINDTYKAMLESGDPNNPPPPPTTTDYQTAYHETLYTLEQKPYPDGFIPDQDAITLAREGKMAQFMTLWDRMPISQRQRIAKQLQGVESQEKAPVKRKAPPPPPPVKKTELQRKLEKTVTQSPRARGVPRTRVEQIVKTLPPDPGAITQEDLAALKKFAGWRRALKEAYGEQAAQELLKKFARSRSPARVKRRASRAE